jgi:Brp/Blh family beta-carotene 15,15'-monooxygenase
MKKYSNIAIFTSFFALWMDSFLSTKGQLILGFLLIFSFGILHGANDLILVKNTLHEKRFGSTLKILGYYLVVVVFGILLFYFLPQLALFLFIIVSAYHFGEQQWQILPNYIPKVITSLFFTLYGLIILFLLFVIHSIEVEKIILNITDSTFSCNYFWPLLVGLGIVYVCLNVYFYFKIKKIKMKLFLEFFYLILFIVIFKSSSLIWGFAIYFIFWHSIPSIIAQVKFLNGSFSKKNFIAYCKSALIYWLISILGIVILYAIFQDTLLFNSLFFSFLAAITFPHVFVIANMFKKKT